MESTTELLDLSVKLFLPLLQTQVINCHDRDKMMTRS